MEKKVVKVDGVSITGPQANNDWITKLISTLIKSKTGKLYLNSNDLRDSNALILANALPSNMEELVIANNSISCTASNAFIDSLASKSPHIKYLSFEDNSITDEGCTYLVSKWDLFTNITHLILDGCEIGDEGAIQIANTVVKSRSLKLLSLNRNIIGLDGITALAEAITNDCVLDSLQVGDNDMGDEGLTVLCKAIASESLWTTEFGLGKNGITLQGIRILAEAIKQSRKVTSIILNSNKFGQQGGQVLYDSIIPSLVKLNLDDNGIEADLIEKINKKLSDNFENSAMEQRIKFSSNAFCGSGFGKRTI
ncbi:hypothetical protein HDV02_001836 [Globomyces sp. JEL0801]|nr:hypothetical protein HDV02_001836 [Globomyces sp. JEL0801]